MSRTKMVGRMLGLAVASSLGLMPSAEAGCKCRGKASASMAPVPMAMPFDGMHGGMRSGVHGGPTYGPEMHGGAMHGPAMHEGVVHNGVLPGGPITGPVGGRYPGLRPHVPSPQPPMERPVAPKWETTAPPGTLGRTYKLCSRPLPEDEHPRNAGLEIKVPNDGIETIRVEKMEDGYVDENGVWHFITEKPLLPHTPPIVKVVMTRIDDGSEVYDVRVVRLIPGRVLTVEF